jgi:SET domain
MEVKENFFQVKNPRADLKHISRHVKVGVDKYYGRFLSSKTNLDAGDVIAIEEPFFQSLEIRSEHFPKRCANCLNSCNSSSFFTCQSCNCVYFCSQVCKKKFETFHKFECKFLPKIEEDDGYFLLVLRALIKSINMCGSLEKFRVFVESRDKMSTIFNANAGELGKLTCCLNLESGNFPQDIKFAKSFVESDLMRQFYSDENQKFFLVKILLKVLGILNRNSFCLEFEDGNSSGAVFAFASLFNHSCSPNVDRINVGNKIAFVCIRPVRENEQLFICYRLAN